MWRDDDVVQPLLLRGLSFPRLVERVDLKPDEASFQSVVVEVARLAGWRVAHFRAAKTSKSSLI